MHPRRNIKWELWKGQFRYHMYPEQVKQIEFITPCAESGINESLVAETSERDFFVNLIIQTWKEYIKDLFLRKIHLYPEQAKRDISESICMQDEKSGIVGKDNYSDITCIPNMWNKQNL